MLVREHPLLPLVEGGTPHREALSIPQSRYVAAMDLAAHREEILIEGIDRITYGGHIMETGTDSYRLAHSRAQRCLRCRGLRRLR